MRAWFDSLAFSSLVALRPSSVAGGVHASSKRPRGNSEFGSEGDLEATGVLLSDVGRTFWLKFLRETHGTQVSRARRPRARALHP